MVAIGDSGAKKAAEGQGGEIGRKAAPQPRSGGPRGATHLGHTAARDVNEGFREFVCKGLANDCRPD